MARINIEDRLYTDKRWLKLCIKFGCEYKALGSLVSLWTLAQRYWKKDKSLIPFEVFNEQEIPGEIIECKFAVKQKRGIYAKGSKDSFAWLLQKVEAGKIGGTKSRKRESSENKGLGVSDGKQTLDDSKPPIPIPFTNPSQNQNPSGEAAAANEKNTFKIFELMTDLSVITNEYARPALSRLSPSAQKNIWNAYKDAAVVEKHMLDCVGHFTTKYAVDNINDVPDLGLKIVAWFKREPSFKRMQKARDERMGVRADTNFAEELRKKVRDNGI